jgi:hypothetical protein
MSDEAAAAAKAAAYAKKNKYRKDKRELQFCCVLQKHWLRKIICVFLLPFTTHIIIGHN